MSFSVEHLAVIALLLDEEDKKKIKRKQRRFCVHPAWRNRKIEGEFTIYKQLMNDELKFHDYFKMTQYSFNVLLNKIKHHIAKQDTRWRRPISPRERLAVCLRYLTTGDSFKSISLSYRLGHSTVYKIVKETSKAIVDHLMTEVMPVPNLTTWKNITTAFWNRCKFPNCLGVLDGKHVTIHAPPNSSSNQFNNKTMFSILLLVLVDANYNFIMVDVGSYGKNNEGEILSHSNMGQAFENGTIKLPPDQLLPGTTQLAPCVIIGDEAFPLKKYLMRPFPGNQVDNHANRNFNYRLSLGRQVLENTFRILVQKFGIYNSRIYANPENIYYIIMATCVLHNFIKKSDGFIEESNSEPMSIFENLSYQDGNASRCAFSVRETFKNFFLSEAGAYDPMT